MYTQYFDRGIYIIYSKDRPVFSSIILYWVWHDSVYHEQLAGGNQYKHLLQQRNILFEQLRYSEENWLVWVTTLPNSEKMFFFIFSPTKTAQPVFEDAKYPCLTLHHPQTDQNYGTTCFGQSASCYTLHRYMHENTPWYYVS